MLIKSIVLLILQVINGIRAQDSGSTIGINLYDAVARTTKGYYNLEYIPLNFYSKAIPISRVIKCSRRFNPGSCYTQARTVWTYDWQTMNCTERMGCRLGVRSNRFMSYGVCIKTCDALRDIYMRYLEESHPGQAPLSKDDDTVPMPVDYRRQNRPDHLSLPWSLASAQRSQEQPPDYQPEDKLQEEDDDSDWEASLASLGLARDIDYSI